jgi:phage terminase small subunit
VKPGKAPTNHDERVGELLRAGWRHDDILPALESSKDEGGNENLETAQDYLENLRRWRLQSVNAQISSKAVDGREESKDRIAANSELAQ